MNLLVKKNLVRGLLNAEYSPKMAFVMLVEKESKENHHSKVRQNHQLMKPLQMLHMDLFGAVNIMSISKKKYCLVIVDDFTRFSMDLLSSFRR